MANPGMKYVIARGDDSLFHKEGDEFGTSLLDNATMYDTLEEAMDELKSIDMNWVVRSITFQARLDDSVKITNNNGWDRQS